MKSDLSKDELTRLLTAAKAYRERDWLMILVAFWHALRASEVVSLTVRSIQDGQLTVQRLKGSMKTRQPLMAHTDPLLDETKGLSDFTRGIHGNQILFDITRERFWQIVQQHGKAAGIPKHKRHPHALKASIAMQIIHSAGIENTRQWLGHKNISSTGEYLKVTDDDAARAVRQALAI